jgi:hypothetical protein
MGRYSSITKGRFQVFPAIRLQFAIFFLSTCSGACAYATAAHAQESRQQSPHSEATESSEHAKTAANSADGQKKAAIEATFKAELEKVKEAAAGSMNVCITSVYIAARDAGIDAARRGRNRTCASSAVFICGLFNSTSGADSRKLGHDK